MADLTIFTIGHSTHPINEFIGMLQAHGIKKLIDARTIPKSRHSPQFNGDSLAASLRQRNHLPADGIARRTAAPPKGQPNSAWRNASFKGYADYMQTEKFAAAVDQLVQRGRNNNAVIMCAEPSPGAATAR